MLAAGSQHLIKHEVVYDMHVAKEHSAIIEHV